MVPSIGKFTDKKQSTDYHGLGTWGNREFNVQFLFEMMESSSSQMERWTDGGDGCTKMRRYLMLLT